MNWLRSFHGIWSRKFKLTDTLKIVSFLYYVTWNYDILTLKITSLFGETKKGKLVSADLNVLWRNILILLQQKRFFKRALTLLERLLANDVESGLVGVGSAY